jgi:hypothetical protein
MKEMPTLGRLESNSREREECGANFARTILEFAPKSAPAWLPHHGKMAFGRRL